MEFFAPGEPDLICDIWTEISRNLAAELESELQADVAARVASMSAPFASASTCGDFACTRFTTSTVFTARAREAMQRFPSEEAAPAITNIAVLPLYFLSGPFVPESETDSERGYVLVAYRVSPWLQPAAYYSLLFPDVERRDGRADLGREDPGDPQGWTFDSALGLSMVLILVLVLQGPIRGVLSAPASKR